MNTPNGGNASTPGQRKKLPVNPSLEHLQKQAKRRVKLDPAFGLAAAQHRIAREYGCKNWAELARIVETMSRGADQLANVRREVEPLPKAARERDIELVRQILASADFTQHDLDQGLAHSLWYGDTSNWTERREIADLLLEYGADPDGQYGSAYGPIVFGVGECLRPEGLEYLIEAGADVTFPPIKTKYGAQCPLSCVLGTYVRGRNADKHRLIDILLRHGAQIPPGVSPPILAIHRGDARELGGFLDREPALLSRRFAGMPYGNLELRGAALLHCAVEFGEIECLEELFQRYADINLQADVIDGIGGQTPLFHAISTFADEGLPVLEYLAQRRGQSLDMGIRATWRRFGKKQTTPMTALEYAEHSARYEEAQGRKRVAEELELVRSLDCAEQLKAAILREDIPTVASLLSAHPALLSPALWPVAIFQAKSLTVTRLLLDRGLTPNACAAPRYPLHLAVYQCLPEIVELLIARGADARFRNSLGETPLELLDAYEPRPLGDPDARRILEALVRVGAEEDLYTVIRSGDAGRLAALLADDPSLAQADSELGGPLFAAARSGRVEIVRLLLAAGADPNRTNRMGNTPLWFAAQSPAHAPDRVAVAQLLLDASAEINRRCEDGSTALHFAAWRGPIAMVELLLAHGGNPNLTDDNGKRPVDFARNGIASEKNLIMRLLENEAAFPPNLAGSRTLSGR